MTPGFLGPLRAELLDDLTGGREVWRLIEPLVYDSEVVGARLTVHAGFESDGESIPRGVAFVSGPPCRKAGTLHDFLYRTRLYERAVCDAIYREALIASGLDPVYADQRLAAVDFYGGAHWPEG